MKLLRQPGLGRRLSQPTSLPLFNFKPPSVGGQVAPGRTRIDLKWMEVTDPGRDLASDTTFDTTTAYIPGDGTQGPYMSFKFARKAYTDDELATLRAERLEGVERRADGSIPCYWAPEYTSKTLRSLKFRIKMALQPDYDARSADVLPGDLALTNWQRQIKYGTRAAHHSRPWQDSRGVRQYKIHKFPAGEFLEICGHLIRINYRAPYWIPNERAIRNYEKRGVWHAPKPDPSGHGIRAAGFFPYIKERFPEQFYFARWRNGAIGTFKEFFADLKELGPIAMFMKMYRLRFYWWGSEGKILIGIDSNGFKYFETPYGAGLAHRARMVETPWGPTWRHGDDVHPAWRTWLQYAILAPPNEPEAWPAWATEYHHMESRWMHNFGLHTHSTSLQHPRTGHLRAGIGRSVALPRIACCRAFVACCVAVVRPRGPLSAVRGPQPRTQRPLARVLVLAAHGVCTVLARCVHPFPIPNMCVARFPRRALHGVVLHLIPTTGSRRTACSGSTPRTPAHACATRASAASPRASVGQAKVSSRTRWSGHQPHGMCRLSHRCLCSHVRSVFDLLLGQNSHTP